MISVILNVEESESGALARTLQNLVSYAVEGFVVEVVVIGDNFDTTTQRLADEAGCNTYPQNTELKKICGNARGEWLLFMEPGSTLETGWADVVAAHASANGGAAYFQLAVSDARAWWQRVLSPRKYKSPLSKGLLISKRQARANLKNQKSPLELVRGLALKRLSASIRPAPFKVS